MQDRDNREATYRDALAKLKSLDSNIAAADRQVLASELQLRETEVRLQQSQKTLANAVAVVGQGEAAQLEPQVEERTAIALQNRVELSEAKLRLCPAQPELHAHPRADSRDHQPANDPAWRDRGSAAAFFEHRAARARRRLGRRQPARGADGPCPGGPTGAHPRRRHSRTDLHRLGRERGGGYRVGLFAVPARQRHRQLRPDRAATPGPRAFRRSRRTTRTGSVPACRRGLSSIPQTLFARAPSTGERTSCSEGKRAYRPGWASRPPSG